jgi:hypothetical protein
MVGWACWVAPVALLLGGVASAGGGGAGGGPFIWLDWFHTISKSGSSWLCTLRFLLHYILGVLYLLDEHCAWLPHEGMPSHTDMMYPYVVAEICRSRVGTLPDMPPTSHMLKVRRGGMPGYTEVYPPRRAGVTFSSRAKIPCGQQSSSSAGEENCSYQKKSVCRHASKPKTIETTGPESAPGTISSHRHPPPRRGHDGPCPVSEPPPLSSDDPLRCCVLSLSRSPSIARAPAAPPRPIDLARKKSPRLAR